MNEDDRKQRIADEIERRAAASGVPQEHHVYEMRTHFSDDGGPRTYVPLRISQNLKNEKYDSSLWPRLFESAMEDGIPIELALDDSRVFRDGRTPVADICRWDHGKDQLLILTERADAVLRPFLQQTCRIVPVTCSAVSLFGYHVTAIEDVLDESNSNARWIGSHCMRISQYSFFTEKLGHSPIFRIPQRPSDILVLQPVVDALVQHKLTGFRFKRLWPQSPIPPVVEIEVKKRPRSQDDMRRDPTLSTAATEFDAGLLTELLGSPLTHDRNLPFQLTAYRLPDLSLPSGAIVAADLLFTEDVPFARRVKPGTYRLVLIAARLSSYDERIAFAMIQLSDRPVAAWEFAVHDKVEGRNSRNRKNHGYGVDSGTGGFCDARAQEAMLDLADPERTQTKRIEKAMQEMYCPTRGWCHVQTEAGSAAIFSSGYGDGQYESYFGLDSAGEAVVVMTDFGVLDWPRRPGGF